MVYSRMLEWVMQSLPEERGEPAGFAVVNYMKVPPGMNGKFLQVRRDYVKPVFDQAVKEGERGKDRQDLVFRHRCSQLHEENNGQYNFVL